MSFKTKLVSVKWLDDLQEYLLSHETDIFHEINDFSQLRLVWDMFFENPPTKEGTTKPMMRYFDEL